jgi:allantoinase
VSERLALASRRVLIGDGLEPATVVIDGERIADVVPGDPLDGAEDLGDLVVMPALVDTHVHVNEPGRTEWEGFATATAAAAAGGVALIVDMPLNSIPPTTSVEGLRVKRAAAETEVLVDVGFWGGIVPGNLDQVAPLAAEGVFGFKSFLVPSGVDEFGTIGLDDLDDALGAVAAVGLPLLVHAEAPGPIESAPPPGADYASYLASRPPAAEVEAITALIDAVRRTGASAHVLHLSAADALPHLAAARREGLPITVETCPHYLALTAETIPAGHAEYKCAPPIRDGENRDRLWEGLAAGVIDMVVSDHSPCPAAMKTGGFDAAWGGIGSLELRLPVVWTEAARRGHGVADLARWLCASPAALAGRSARLVPGDPADLVVWDPEAEFTVEPGALAQRHQLTPYTGMTLRGRVERTLVRGGAGRGRLVRRT